MTDNTNMTNDKFKKFEHIRSKLKIDQSDTPLSLSQLNQIEKNRE